MSLLLVTTIKSVHDIFCSKIIRLAQDKSQLFFSHTKKKLTFKTGCVIHMPLQFMATKI